jgi:hypothetical protein
MQFTRSYAKRLLIGTIISTIFCAGGQRICRADDGESEQSQARYYITFDGRRFYLAYVSDKQDQKLKEYIPEREDLERWNHLMSIRVFPKFPKDVGVEGYVNEMAEAIKTKDSANRCEVIKNDDGSQVLDFLMWETKSEYFAEWNLMRVEYIDDVGLVVCQYANRFYFSDPDEAQMIKFGTELRELREKMLPIFEKADFEEREEQVVNASG